VKTRAPLDGYLLVLLTLTLLFFGLYTQRAPYFADTAAYAESARESIAHRTLPSALAVRFLNIYFYIPFVWLLGDAGIRVLSVGLIVAFSGVYYRVLRRDWGNRVAFGGSLMLLAVPASVITVTHLKEDFVGLLLVMLALWLIGPRASWGRSAAAGCLFGLACLSKEQPLTLLPFMLAQVGIGYAPDGGWRELVRHAWLRPALLPAAAFLAATAATILGLSPGYFGQVSALTTSPYGQVLGVGSAMQARGAALWREGMLHLAVLHLLLIPVAIRAIRRRALTSLAWLATALGSFLFASNTSVVQSRHFVMSAVFAAPLIALAIDRAAAWFERVEGAGTPRRPGARGAARPAPRHHRVRRRLAAATLPAVAVVLAAFQIADLLPTLRYRHAYPPQAEYYARLKGELPAGALLAGTDESALASHFTGHACLRAPADLDQPHARAFTVALVESARTRPLYGLPDLFTYDRAGHFERSIRAAFALERAYVALGEDYHLMTYGRRMSAVLKDLEHRGCVAGAPEAVPIAITPSLSATFSRRRLHCPGQEHTLECIEYQGVQTFLTPRTVARLVPVGP
jgi:dolichyl-phosphate-mannose-protein mannosyltransferase